MTVGIIYRVPGLGAVLGCDSRTTTGDGESLAFSTGHFYSMTTHARGGVYLEPATRSVLDVGAQVVFADKGLSVSGLFAPGAPVAATLTSGRKYEVYAKVLF